MGVREQINDHRHLAGGTAIAIIVIGTILVIFNFSGANQSHPTRTKGKAWFSDDDGKTWFADDEHNLPPFNHNGRAAYRAYVYSCDGGKTKFVAFLARFTPEGKIRLRRSLATGEPINIGLIGLSPSSGLEVKRPGAAQPWARASDPRGVVIQRPVCPGGSSGTPEPVLP